MSHDLPLHGVRVIEQGSFITGPYASMILADMGADVVKVERPGQGDVFRTYDGSLYSPTFQAFNRNKRSVTIDNRDADDRRIMDDLITSADVYIQNFRPGVADRIGVGYNDLRRLNPALVYCSITGYGNSGPYVHRPAYDTVAQAISGLLGMTLDPSQPRIAGPAIADAVTGLYAAHSTLAALIDTMRSGRGHLVEVSMMEALANFLTEPFSSLFGVKSEPGPYGRAAVSQSYAVECSDGERLAFHLSSPEKFWMGLLSATDRRDLAADERFATRELRVANHDALRLELQATFVRQPRDYWLPRLVEHDVPSAPVLKLADVLEDPQAQHLQLEATMNHPEHGELRAIRPAASFDGVRRTYLSAPPTLGEHNAEIREEISTSKFAIVPDHERN